MRHEPGQRGATSPPLPLYWRRSRSTLASIAGHVLAVSLLFVSFAGGPVLVDEAPFITAEIVPLTRPTLPAPASPAAETALPSAAPHEAVAPPATEPAATAATTPAPSVVVVEPAPAASTSSVEATAESSDEPAEVATNHSEPAAPAEGEQPGESVATADRAAVARAYPVATDERRAIERRLASWTGRLDADAERLTWREQGVEYSAVLRPLANTNVMGMEHVAVEVTTERGGARLVTELKMTRLAFSNFGQFVNRWDKDVGLYDDVIEGRFHSNTAFVVNDGDKSPVFAGKVTVADRSVDSPGSRQKMFPAGIETHVRRIALPERAFATAATADSQLFERDTAITFLADGRVQWRELGSAAVAADRSLGNGPFYLVAGDDVELQVSGTVNGQVLVYSPHRIAITGDIYYATHPLEPHADDYLGLVTDGIVEIAEPDVTGPGDLEVYASIYARRSFEVRRYMSRHSGTLRIHGSLTAGTLDATEPRYGTHIVFDNRLTTMRAPGFPLSDRYELDSASGEWRVVTTP